MEDGGRLVHVNISLTSGEIMPKMVRLVFQLNCMIQAWNKERLLNRIDFSGCKEVQCSPIVPTTQNSLVLHAFLLSLVTIDTLSDQQVTAESTYHILKGQSGVQCWIHGIKYTKDDWSSAWGSICRGPTGRYLHTPHSDEFSCCWRRMLKNSIVFFVCFFIFILC